MYDPDKHHRRSIRLKGHDYASPGAYFVTVCTNGMQPLLGNVIDGKMMLNETGRIAEGCWFDIPNHFPQTTLDAYVVMPNHVHGIIWILDEDGSRRFADVGAKNLSPLPETTPFRSPSRTIGSVVRGFKIGVTKWFRANADTHKVWQRDYYEHVIRNEQSLNRIRRYIRLNPACWEFDHYNPDAIEPTDNFAWVQNPHTTQSPIPMPHTYDSLTVGDDFSWSRTLTVDDVRAFADITGDDNPLHVDADYAAGTRFGKPVVHGVYILGLASKVLGRDFPGHGSIAVSLQAKFLRPVPVGEEVTIQVKVAEKIEKHRHVKMRLFAYVGGRMAVGGEAVVIPPNNGRGE